MSVRTEKKIPNSTHTSSRNVEPQSHFSNFIFDCQLSCSSVSYNVKWVTCTKRPIPGHLIFEDNFDFFYHRKKSEVANARTSMEEITLLIEIQSLLIHLKGTQTIEYIH